MSGIHQVSCATSNKHSGYGGCPIDWKLIKGAFLYLSPTSFGEAQLANLQSVLQTQAWQDSEAGRCIPVHQFLNPQDNTDDPTFETFADGSKAFVRDGVYDWTFQITAGGFCLLQGLRTMNGNGSVYAFFYDAEYKILGYSNTGELAAIPLMSFQALPWKMNTGSNTAKYLLRFIFATAYANESSEYTKANFPLFNIKGIQDLKLLVNGFNASTGVAQIAVITECGGSNLFTQYAAALANGAMWVATNAITGNTIPITSVTQEVGPQAFNIAFNTGSASYPNSGLINLSLVAPSLLSAAGLPGYISELVELNVINS